MEIKKSEKASLENKKLLFTEIGLVVALGIVWAAFEHSSKDAQVAVLEDTTQVLVEEEMVAIQNDTPPPPPEAPNIPVLSDQIDIVDDDIKLDDDMFMNLEDDNTGVEIMDYKEAEVVEEEVEEEAIPFQLVEGSCNPPVHCGGRRPRDQREGPAWRRRIPGQGSRPRCLQLPEVEARQAA